MYDNELRQILEQIQSLQLELDGLRQMVEMLQRKIANENPSDRIREHALEVIENTAEPVAVNLPNQNYRRNRGNAPASAPNTSNFLQDYYALESKIGLELKNAREEFLRRYQVRTFSCVNAEARVKTPTPPPVFRDKEAGDFWAIPGALVSNAGGATGNNYFVLPSNFIRQYTANHHFQRAMGEFFNSDFKTGNAYNRIYVEAPAVCTCIGNIWKVVSKGKLRLS